METCTTIDTTLHNLNDLNEMAKKALNLLNYAGCQEDEDEGNELLKEAAAAAATIGAALLRKRDFHYVDLALIMGQEHIVRLKDGRVYITMNDGEDWKSLEADRFYTKDTLQDSFLSKWAATSFEFHPILRWTDKWAQAGWDAFGMQVAHLHPRLNPGIRHNDLKKVVGKGLLKTLTTGKVGVFDNIEDWRWLEASYLYTDTWKACFMRTAAQTAALSQDELSIRAKFWRLLQKEFATWPADVKPSLWHYVANGEIPAEDYWHSFQLKIKSIFNWKEDFLTLPTTIKAVETLYLDSGDVGYDDDEIVMPEWAVTLSEGVDFSELATTTRTLSVLGSKLNNCLANYNNELAANELVVFYLVCPETGEEAALGFHLSSETGKWKLNEEHDFTSYDNMPVTSAILIAFKDKVKEVVAKI